MEKGARTARLVKVLLLLHQHPRGLTAREVAEECETQLKTAYRDLDALEMYTGIPTYKDGHKYCLVEGACLPPIPFTLPEALNIFLSARLMATYAHRYDPNIALTFSKLSAVVPDPLKEQILKTNKWLEGQREDEVYFRTMATLAEAWVNGRTVKIRYHTLGEEKPMERNFDPYFIQPAAAGHSSYAIGRCHLKNEIRVFKIERILSIGITEQQYSVPDDFDANQFFASSWGIVSGGEAETVKLRFVPQLARIPEEVVWHPSQRVKRQSDGSAIMTLKVQTTYELLSWILGWGEKVEVLEPKRLRKEVVQAARTILKVYDKKA